MTSEMEYAFGQKQMYPAGLAVPPGNASLGQPMFPQASLSAGHNIRFGSHARLHQP